MSEILGTLFKYLLSLLGVGAVVTVLYAGFGSNKTQTFISDLTLLQSNITGLYQGAPAGFASLTNAVAISGKLAPSDMIAGNALTTPWTGGVATVAGTATQFTITATEVPADACAKAAVAFPTAAAIGVGAAGSTAVVLPVDPGVVAGQCAATNTMVFTFGR
jgi:hypothetical protein